MQLDLTGDHAGHEIKQVPSPTVSSMIGGTFREEIEWVDFCTDCKEVVE